MANPAPFSPQDPQPLSALEPEVQAEEARFGRRWQAAGPGCLVF